MVRCAVFQHLAIHPDISAFLDERDGTLLAGDALVTVGGELRTAADAPWFFPLPTLATWHKPTALASAARLRELSIERIAPGARQSSCDRSEEAHGRCGCSLANDRTTRLAALASAAPVEADGAG